MKTAEENLLIQEKERPAEFAPALFKEFLENQAKELEIKARDLDLQKQKDDHSFEFAKTALEAQKEDRAEQRTFQIKTKRNGHIFTTIISVLFVTLLVTALAMDKDQVALEIIKAVIFMATGGAGGYAIGRFRNDGDSDNSTRKKDS